MDFFAVLGFIGGLGYFIFGMRTLTGGLAELSGGKQPNLLPEMLKSPLRAGLCGVAVTAAVQSSSAVTVLLIGMAEAGTVSLTAAGYLLLGANVGTTVTPWVLSLAGLSGSSPLTAFLKPSAFAPLAAFVGILCMLCGKKGRIKSFGTAGCGFAVLMLGMERMQQAVQPLQELSGFAGLTEILSSPVAAALIAAAFTALIQSSTASVGILQALAMTGGLSYGMILPVVMGQNVGTCITGILSAVGGGAAARGVARFNLAINVIGAAVGVGIMYLLRPFCGHFFARPATAADIALWHSLFNILSAVLLWPAVPWICRTVSPERRGAMKKYFPSR